LLYNTLFYSHDIAAEKGNWTFYCTLNNVIILQRIRSQLVVYDQHSQQNASKKVIL